MDIEKIRKRWKAEEQHEDKTIDYAISEIYRLCDKVSDLDDQLNAYQTVRSPTNPLWLKNKELETENEKLKKCLPIQHSAGFIEGLKEFAWWKDGIQYVGTCGTTLKEAIAQVLKGGEE